MNAKGEADIFDSTGIEDRYEIERVLGQGSAGIVYRVRDRETGERLALKKLLRVDPRSVQLLKHEFRALADLHHPNLVKLYDLGRTRGAWFITLEYLRGTDLLTYLNTAPDPLSTQGRGLPANDNSKGPALARLCGAFAQLAHGIEALHRAGMLHRDLKPRNVMTDEARVVVLDFGLVREVGDTAATVTRDGTVAGTPAYMAPEQAEDTPLSAATDWYALGVMLYEALSGALPFDGGVLELLRKKLAAQLVPLDQRVSYVPKELSALCMSLLARNPQQRPDYKTIIQTLDSLAPQLAFMAPLGPVSGHAPGRPQPLAAIVGRSVELDLLTQAFERARIGKCVAVHVRSASGNGKSALVEHFLESLKLSAAYQPGDVLALRARCHAREAMPFKALDGLLDGLTAFLERMDEIWVSHVLPVHVADLARAFPVLERLAAMQKLLAQAQAPARGDAVLVRANAESALRELLRRVARRQALVLFIDDLQWGDLDSVRILNSWLQAEEKLPVLLLLTYRSDELATNPCLQLLAAAEQDHTAEQLFIDVPPLPRTAIEEMCRASTGNLPASWVERIASEAHGSPLIATQLLTLAQAQLERGLGDDDAHALSIADLLTQLTALVQPQGRRMLHLLAIAGRPVDVTLAMRAAELTREDRGHLHALQGLRLTRTRVVSGKQLIEIYHERIRAALVAALPANERISLNRRLLSELMNRGQADPDWLHVLALGAHDHELAGVFLRSAAERAAASLAFERAAELYQACLHDQSLDAAERGELLRALGDNLAASGHGSQAAERYLQAAQLEAAERGAKVTELKRLAATHLIRSGHFTRGEQLVRDVVTALHMRVPQTRLGLILAIGWERLRLWLRGLDFEPREVAQLPAASLYLAHTYVSLSINTQAYDPVRAALFQARALRLALELGEPSTLASALCVAAATRGVSGSARDDRYAQRLLDCASEINKERKDPLMQVRILSTRVITSFLLGRVNEVLGLAKEVDLLHNSPTSTRAEFAGEYYLRLMVNSALIGTLFQLGQFRQAGAALHRALQRARATEDRSAQLHLAMVWSVDEIAQGQAARARARLDADRPALPPGFGPLHLLHMVAVMRVACALAGYDWANAILAELWPQFERSIVKRSVLSLLAYGAHTRLLLNQHVLSGSQADPEALVRRELRAIRRRSGRLRRALTSRYDARIAYMRGQHELARKLFREHIEACAEQGYNDEVERGRWALGQIIGGDEGQKLRDAAIQRLTDLGFVQPLADMSTHYPELFR